MTPSEVSTHPGLTWLVNKSIRRAALEDPRSLSGTDHQMSEHLIIQTKVFDKDVRDNSLFLELWVIKKFNTFPRNLGNRNFYEQQ